MCTSQFPIAIKPVEKSTFQLLRSEKPAKRHPKLPLALQNEGTTWALNHN
jgi:hypothetical protein